MESTTRFGSPSITLNLGVLLKRTKRVLWMALAAGIVAHFLAAQWRGTRQEARRVRPLTTQFIKRQPRLTKPLELKKVPRPKRRQIQRTMVSVKARARPDRSVSRFQPAQILGRVAAPQSRVARVAAPGPATFEVEAVAGLVEGAREIEQKIDMSLELLDLEALDTGKYHALVVQDPEDRKGIRGFCHLAIADLKGAFPPTGYTFEFYVLPGFHRLAATVNECTDITTDVLGRLTLGDAELSKVPWLFLSAHESFRLSDTELENFGEYLTAGGLAFADGDDARVGTRRPGLRALVNTLRDALKTQGFEALFEKLDNSHPIYHCYFDFDGPPIGGDGLSAKVHDCEVIPYIEGIEVDGRLAAILSRKKYTHAWTFWGPGNYLSDGGFVTLDPKRPLQFGVNTIIFALTQEGSITHQLMDSIR